jgi:hypothetical protein
MENGIDRSLRYMGPMHESAAMPFSPVIGCDCNASDHANLKGLASDLNLPPVGGEVSNYLPTLSKDYNDRRCPV